MQTLKKAPKIRCRCLEECLEALRSGEIDGVLAPELQALHFMASNGTLPEPGRDGKMSYDHYGAFTLNYSIVLMNESESKAILN